MAPVPKIKIKAIPVFPSDVTGDIGVDVAKANGAYTIMLDVSNFQIANVPEGETGTTYAVAFGAVTTDNPLGSYSLVPFSGFQGRSSDLTSLSELGTFGIVTRIGDADYVTRTLTGTANRLIVTNGGGVAGSPTFDISTSYVGQPTITTLGTVATGVWQGTVIGATYGGFGTNVSAASGVPLFATGVPTFTGTSGTGNFVRVTSPALVTPDLGAPSAAILTNATGTAAGLTAGHVTTNANLTGDVTSVGNAATLTTAQPAAHTWALAQTLTVAPVFTDQSGSRTALGLGTMATVSSTAGGDLAGTFPNPTINNAPVIAKVLTGYTSGAGTISATDSILSAIQKLNGNDATNANLTGDVTSIGNATTLAAGNAGNLNSGTLLAARMPALTGEATTSAGAVAVTLTNSAVIGKVLTGYTSGAGAVAATDSILQAIQKLNGNDATNANLTGDVTSVGNATTLTNAPVIAKVLTGYTSGAGTISATDSILSAIQKLNGNDATNANLTGVITSVGNATSIASQTGTGTKFVVDTSPTLVTPNIGVAAGTSLAATGALTSSSPTAGIGYAAGAGGTVTQITSKATGVTLNKTTGLITMNNAALAASATVTFTLNNTTIAAADFVHVGIDNGIGAVATYRVVAEFVGGIGGNGVFISLTNISGGSLSEAVVIKFYVFKAAST